MLNDTQKPADISDVVPIATSRRNFLLSASLTAVGAGTLIACGKASPDVRAQTGVPAGASGGTMGAHETAAPASALSASAKADAMDAMHEKGIKAFPAKTEGRGNQIFEPRMDKGVKVFDITAKVVQWEVEPGRKVEAWTYNGVVPAPQIRVRQGDRMRLVLKNELPESTAIHFHGLELPNNQDGVPFITQPPVKPGESYTYEFTVPNAGSHMYHSHHNSAKQVGLGLLGAIIVEPRRPRAIEKVDVDYVMILNDGAHGYTLNGKGFPATEPISAKLGQKIRVRFMNEGMMIHPMHLHGMHMTVIDKDGWPQPQPWKCDTLNIAPGERWDVIVNCNNPGTWAFHCHILPHAETEHGMFGMVTALIVTA
ncbi:MAG: multicopper oxidase domain-containing protein [Gemmatimonadaceae bacterium]|nr:multicopper oxidase domain-containing protein [Gemmatimonadaceae bacterium]